MTEANLSPQQLFERGIVTPERYLGWQTSKTRERVWRLMQTYGHSLAEALDDLWWVGGL